VIKSSQKGTISWDSTAEKQRRGEEFLDIKTLIEDFEGFN
jgi:hypothetical protein